MHTDENGKLTITDEDGNQKEMEIILTFDDDKSGRKFVLFSDPADPDSQVYAYTYDEDGNMDALTSDEDWQMCEEVLAAFQDEEGLHEDGSEKEA